MTAPEKPHWNQKGAAPRVRLAGGPLIDQGTLATLATWQQRGPSYGEIIDRLCAYATASGFDPVTNQPVTNTGAPRKPRARR